MSRCVCRCDAGWVTVGAAVLAAWVHGASAELVYPMDSSGYVLIECEEMPHSSRWLTQTEHAGYTGTGYLYWDGPCQSCECLGVPADAHHNDITVSCQGPVADWLGFTVYLPQSGRYTLDVRNWHAGVDGANDAWMAAVDTSMRVAADQGEPDLVIYRVVDSVAGEWSWCTSDLWDFNSYIVTEPGFYSFYLAARSTAFNADRIALKRAIGNHLFPPASEDPLTPATLPVEGSTITGVKAACGRPSGSPAHARGLRVWGRGDASPAPHSFDIRGRRVGGSAPGVVVLAGTSRWPRTAPAVLLQ